MRAQVSVEYLLIMGFVAIMTVPLVILYHTYSVDSKAEIMVQQVNQIAARVADAAESVYFLGEPSQMTIDVYIPELIKGASLDNQEVLFNVSTRSGITQVFQVSSVNLTGSLPKKQGRYSIVLKAGSKAVEVSYK